MDQDRLAFGFFDADVRALLEQCAWFVERCWCVLTCLDSGMDTARIPMLHEIGASAIGRFAVVPGALAIEKRQQLFSGFDEFFVFEDERWRSLDASVWPVQRTSERVELRSALPNELRTTFESWGAVRYASDGVGLNVVSRTPEDLKLLASALG